MHTCLRAREQRNAVFIVRRTDATACPPGAMLRGEGAHRPVSMNFVAGWDGAGGARARARERERERDRKGGQVCAVHPLCVLGCRKHEQKNP